MTRVVETLKGEGKLVSSIAENILTFHLEVVEETGIAPMSPGRLEDHRWLCGPSLFGPRTPTIVGEIHLTPARWKKVSGVLQKTRMDCRDGRNPKRLKNFTHSMSNGSDKRERETRISCAKTVDSWFGERNHQYLKACPRRWSGPSNRSHDTLATL
jgi:hypothetical protein